MMMWPVKSDLQIPVSFNCELRFPMDSNVYNSVNKSYIFFMQNTYKILENSDQYLISYIHIAQC